MVKTRVFSLYDIEEFLKEAGAERINERAVVSLEEELESTVEELMTDAQLYANYAGRKRLITANDIMLAKEIGPGRAPPVNAKPKKRQISKPRLTGVQIPSSLLQA